MDNEWYELKRKEQDELRKAQDIIDELAKSYEEDGYYLEGDNTEVSHNISDMAFDDMHEELKKAKDSYNIFQEESFFETPLDKYCWMGNEKRGYNIFRAEDLKVVLQAIFERLEQIGKRLTYKQQNVVDTAFKELQKDLRNTIK